MDFHSELGGSEILAGASLLSRPAEEYENDLVCSITPKLLRLTPQDEKIYVDFRAVFPDLDVKIVKEDIIKSAEAKEKWRPFCDSFKELVEDFNFATLLRLDAHGEYNEENTCIVPRVQFLAIELARNREGINDALKDKFKPQKLGKSS